MSDKPLLIIQMGVPPDDIIADFGEQARWIQDALGEAARDMSIQIVRPAAGEALPEPRAVAGAIITGSWNMVTDREDWSERTAEWVRHAFRADVPLLGICYGHQLMAHALGGRVDYHPQGRELGCYAVQTVTDLTDDPLLHVLPDDFPALLSHEQAVLDIPDGARVLARSAHDAHQILRYGPHALSVQFHPEFSQSIMRACMTRRRLELLREGADVDAMLGRVQDTAHARRILTGFMAQALHQAAAQALPKRKASSSCADTPTEDAPMLSL